MKNLQQDKYEDDNGREFNAADVDVLAPYVHHADGFYSWTCGGCAQEHSDRWWNISGRVVKCANCQKMNLLVRTNCREITELTRRNFEAEYDKKELERLKGIEKHNADELTRIRRKLIEAVQNTPM
jgi:hypothetical protein